MMQVFDRDRIIENDLSNSHFLLPQKPLASRPAYTRASPSPQALNEVDIRRLLADSELEKKHIAAYRQALFDKFQQEAAAYQAKYDPEEDTESPARVWRFFRIRRTKKGKLKFFINLFLTLGYSLLCGLSIMGSLVALPGMPIFVALLGLFFSTVVNWQIAKNKVPEVISTIFFEKFMRYLVKYTAAEYGQLLVEYFAEQEDEIQRLRNKIAIYLTEKEADPITAWSYWKKRDYNRTLAELQRLLKERRHGIVPSRELSWYKKAILYLSIPVNLTAAIVVAILIASLAAKSLAAMSIISVALFPPAWLIVLTAFLVIPIMMGLFTYGFASLLKIHHAFKKSVRFFLDFFKTQRRVTLAHGQQSGLIKVYTLASVVKGLFKSVIVVVLIAIVTYGVAAQSFGGGVALVSIFQDYTNVAWTAIADLVLPIISTCAQLPFFWKQTAETLKSWFNDGLDYFRDPIVVLHKKIEVSKQLLASGELGEYKGRLLIQAQEKCQAQILEQELKLQESQITVDFSQLSGLGSLPFINKIRFVLSYGKLLHKIPYWIRDLTFQIPRLMNALGNGFLSLYGAMYSSPAGGGRPVVTMPDAGDVIAASGGAFGTFCLGGKDPASPLPAHTEAKHLQVLRAERSLTYSESSRSLLRHGIVRQMATGLARSSASENEISMTLQGENRRNVGERTLLLPSRTRGR